MKVEFCPPALGTNVVPIPITGPGTLLLEEDGLHVVGSKVVGRGRGALIILTLLLGTAAAFTLRMALDIENVWTYVAIIFAGGSFLITMLKKPAKAGEEVRCTIPWTKIKKVYWDALNECIIVVVKRMKPKGGLYIRQPKGSELEAEIRKRCS